MADTKFKRGNPGKPKGAKDKISRTAKENIEKAVEHIGGWKELAKWAKKKSRNQEKLYDWYFKMLPTNVTGTINANVKVLKFDFGDSGE